MTRKIYRTAQGRMVDLGALQLQNENVRAVGNMGVNARGDLLNADNQPISTRNKQVSKQYRQQTTSNVSKSSVRSSQQETVKELIEIPTPPEDFDDTFEKPVEIGTAETAPAEAAAPQGLAAAIARAREVRQEPITSPLLRQAKQTRRI